MRGLIKKDLLMIKSNLKTIAIIFCVFILMSFQGKTDISFILSLICIMLMISTFNYDEYNKWDAYAITFPNGRNDIVKSKYLATILLVLIATIITLVFSLAINYSKNTLNLENVVSNLFGGLFAVILIQSLMYPLIFKLGVEKGRIGLFIGAFSVSLVFGVFANKIDLNQVSTFLNSYGLIIIPLIMIIMLTISYFVSKKIYLKKEF